MNSTAAMSLPNLLTPSSDGSNSFRFRMLNPRDASSMNAISQSDSHHKFAIPIVGYEVIEERAKFTVFKLRIQNTTVGEYWFVFRRYTDFVRLCTKIKTLFPNAKLSLPRKRWFGDNFDPRFLNDRVSGLQEFVNSILQNSQLSSSKAVRDFFCLDEPPSYAESVEESRAIFEALEETIYHLRTELQSKDREIERLRLNLSTETKKKEELFKFVTSTTKKCTHCVQECQQVDITAKNPGSAMLRGAGDAYVVPNKNMPQIMQVQDVKSILAQMD